MIYWDASAVVPLLVRQARTPDVTRVLIEDAALVTWWGTTVECTSALMRLHREGYLDADAVATAEQRLRELRSTWSEVLPTDSCRQVTERMLRVHALPAADALQLAAALVASDHDPTRLGVACLDQRLAEALRKEGFPLALRP